MAFSPRRRDKGGEAEIHPARRQARSHPTLTPEQQAEAQRIYEALRQAADADLRAVAELLASRPDGQLLGATEFEVRDRVHRIGAKATQAALDGRKKGGYVGSSTACPHCREAAKFQRWQAKTFVSVLGEVRCERAYYHCPRCKKGHCPWEAALRVGATDLTPGAQEAVSLAGLLASFAEARQKVLPELAGLRLSEATVQRTTEQAGRRPAP